MCVNWSFYFTLYFSIRCPFLWLCLFVYIRTNRSISACLTVCLEFKWVIKVSCTVVIGIYLLFDIAKLNYFIYIPYKLQTKIIQQIFVSNFQSPFLTKNKLRMEDNLEAYEELRVGGFLGSHSFPYSMILLNVCVCCNRKQTH